MTQTITAHFDGRVIVPDEPVRFPVGQPLRVRLEVDSDTPRFATLLEFASDLPRARLTYPYDTTAPHPRVTHRDNDR